MVYISDGDGKMKPRERENKRYAAGATNLVTLPKQLMFSLLPHSPGKLLDVGCGIGTVTKELTILVRILLERQ